MQLDYLAQDLMNSPITMDYLQALTNKFILSNLSKEQRLKYYELAQQNQQENILIYLKQTIKDFDNKLEEYVSQNYLKILSQSK